MLDENLKTQLKAYLEKLTHPVDIIASIDASAKSHEMLAMLKDIAELSDKLALTESPDDKERKPSFLLRRAGNSYGCPLRRYPNGA